MEKSKSGGRVVLAWAREITIVVVGALIASTLIRIFLLQMFQIPSGSMENTLQEGDRVAVLKVGGFDRGDVVVFRDDKSWMSGPDKVPTPVERVLAFIGLMPDESVGYLIKRVIGTEGDRVVCCDANGRLTVNGVPLEENAYLYIDPLTGEQVDPSTSSFDVVVPKGHIWVMGDHRNASADSREHFNSPPPDEGLATNAFIDVGAVQGKAIALVYPFNRFRGLGRPASFDSIPAPESIPLEPIINVEITGR